MDKQLITQLKTQFDQSLHRLEDADIEFCYARELMVLLGYDRWENFLNVIEKAKHACRNSKIEVENHFRDVTKMVTIGSGAERPVADVMLTRYACYLVAQNGDPRKTEIAFAQTYFALQTRKQELLEERFALQSRMDARQKLRESETELSRNIYERGVDDQGFGRIRSKGDTALFGGKNTQTMKKQLAIPDNRPLADFLPTVTIAAKNLATEITNHNVKRRHDLHGEEAITDEHVQNNLSVRNMLGQRGIKPEELPAEEDLKKLERRVASAERKMIKESALPKRGKK
ncbi:DNA damage-inducible protein D [Nitrosomonas sp. Nm33]|uniref:DNA damage-inducible protein D n=1 Tax=Nitrosomonas sp. Nm33 TaxID=133724 RepID=UPI0008947C88|nr:DNA damage-inducible protein D [Nitrosomonas sp. Nm33]SDY75181.1 DNA-damage-inducible protein D [Nitrosomonas sp. Nm33]